ncbi:MAG TPA: hypothetical protein VIF63_00010 [Candidatus Limnocylindrales bacterium]
MAPLLLAAAGVVALAIAVAILRSFGPGFRVGRLLAAVPQVSVAEAIRIAEAGERRYVRIDGRIDSDADFEDADHRPLVLRRTTLAWRPQGSRGGWKTAETRLEVVRFVVSEGLDEIDVDGSSLDEGLVTVPRESVGRADDVDQLTAAGIPADAQARLRVGHVSTIDHATVLGVPSKGAGGVVMIGPGLGRPLILSTLERDEAMRVLSGGAINRSRAAIACLAAGGALLALALVWWLVDAMTGGVATVLAASPDPTLRPGTDTRTSGGGPGIVGEPLLALFGVLGIALVSLGASLAYVRLTRDPKVLPGNRRPRP